MDTRVVLVTGASRGIGRAVAARFRADGAEVVVTGRDEATLSRTAAEIGARAVRCDHTEPGDVRDLAGALAESGVDVLVHCAGGTSTSRRRYPRSRHWNRSPSDGGPTWISTS